VRSRLLADIDAWLAALDNTAGLDGRRRSPGYQSACQSSESSLS
jgi:hypothetical protein